MIESGLLIFVYFFCFFVVAQIIKNNSIVDIGWGIGFVIVAWFVLIKNMTFSLPQIIVTCYVTLWGIRLFYHILKRNVGKGEDFRYANWRREWGKWLVPRSFFQVFMLQGLFMFVISLPIILLGSVNTGYSLPGIVLGMLVWITGFYFEAVGDFQLKKFKENPQNKGKLMTSGLWSYTRHPNYFGEATMWWGIFVIAASCGVSLVAIISPITISILLVFVSGIPILEKSMKNNPEFGDYAKKTSMFFPWFPKK